MKSVFEISQELEKLEGETLPFHQKHWDAAKSAYKFGIGSTEHTELLQRQADLAKLNDELTAAKAAAGFAEQLESARNGGTPESRVPTGGVGFAQKTVGEIFTECEAFKSAPKDRRDKISEEIGHLTVEEAMKRSAMKTAYTHTSGATNAGFAPFSPRQNIIESYANQAIVIQDLIPTVNIDVASVIWMEQVLQDNQAAMVAETNTKPQSTYKWVQRSTPVEVVAHWAAITRQQLEDVPQLKAVIDEELMYGLRLKIQDELLNGNGTSPELKGILNASGIQTQAKGGDDTFTTIMKAFTKIRGTVAGTGFAEPTAGVMHPNDWQDLVTTKDSTGRFIYGDPANEIVPRVWGKLIVVTPSITENTALWGDFAHKVRLWIRHGMRVETGYINDDFVKNQLVVLCEQRLAQTILRGSAFCTTTGI